ncbi:MAG: hypothetical protein K2J68_04560, partial [Treponemataceae bacterium]|nr:hypothetical protein [Treponemataceae bacterium]
MTAVFIIIVVLGTLVLNAVFAKKIAKKEFRIFTEAMNVVVAVALVVLFVVAGFANRHLKVFLEQQTARLELTINRIYPDAFEKSFSTAEVKDMLKSSLETFESPDSGIETIAVNLVKIRFDKYISLALSAINALEQTEGTISMKDAITSLESLMLGKTTMFFKLIRCVLIVIYVVFFIVSLFVSNYLKGEGRKENKSIVFGEGQ